MYATGGTLPVAELPAGATVACLGPSLARKWGTAADLLVTGLDRGEAAVVVSTDESAASLSTATPALDADAVRIVDCIGNDVDTPDVWSVGSPADLTGIGIALSEALDELSKAGHDHIWVVIDSVTSLAVYTDADRLYRFLHAMSRQLKARGALGLLIAHTDGDPTESGNAVSSLADFRVEFRTEADQTQLRVVDAGRTTEWVAAGREPSGSDPSGASERQLPTGPPIDSLRALLDTVEDERLTLLVVNAAEETTERLADPFERLNVEVRGATFPEGPDAFVVLMRDGELLAADPVGRVVAGIDAFDGESLPDRTALSSVFSTASSSVFDVESVDRPELVRASRLFEQVAWRGGTGTLHAGFQRFSRLLVDEETRELYRALARGGVDVHLYGRPDADPDVEGATLHDEETPEIRDCWFVVYDGGGDPDRMGALLCEEREPGTYDGFWTFRSELVASLLGYLEDTYGRPVADV